MTGKAWSSMKAHWKIAIGAIGAMMALAIGGLSIALASSGGEAERSDDRDRFVPGGPPFAMELDPELEAQMEEFRDCMADEGFEPPEPSERPDISEGPPEGLSDAFEACEELLPEGLPPGPPGMGPGPGAIDCKDVPKPPNAERSGGSESSQDQSGE